MTVDPFKSLEEEYKERTRERILEAAIDHMREAGEENLSIAAVALSAGVSDRTVYRHFQTRDALVAAVWGRLMELIAVEEWNETSLVEKPRQSFPRFDQESELMRAFLHSRGKRQAPVRPDAQSQLAMVDCLRDDLPDLDMRTLRRRAAIAQVIASPYCWEIMKNSWGFGGREAGEAAAEALEILLNRRLAS